MQSRRSVAAISLLLVLFLTGKSSGAEPVQYPQCAIEASTTPLDSLIHLYGTGPGEFSVPDSFPVFSMVFDLYVTDSVVVRFDADSIAYFIDQIMDNDSTDLSDDLFPIVWDYFCFKDSNDAYAGVDITVGTNRYTKLKITLYDVDEVGCACTKTSSVLCCGYSTINGGGVVLSTREGGGNPIALDTVLGQGFAHELQHVCSEANGWSIETGNFGYFNLAETFATLAEYRSGAFRQRVYDWPYDESILRAEECATNNYVSEKIWMAYLYETFKGGPSDTDDLIYEWIRQDPIDPTLSGLADMLWEGGYTWAGGVNADERFNNVFQYFAVAKFANAPDLVSNSRFGSTEFNSMDTFGFFADNCDWFADSIPTPNEPVDCPPNSDHEGCWNVRILPPVYTLGSSDENTMTVVDGIYTDADGSMDYIDVAVYGTDYIVFSADSYFQDGDDHELHVSLRGGYNHTTDKEPFVWVLGYDTAATDLPLLPGNLRFAEPATAAQVTSSPDTFEVSAVVNGFGGEIQSVVVAPCTEDAPDGCYLLTIPLPLALQGVRIDRASLTLDVVPGAESGIADTGFGIIRVGLPGDLTAGGSGTDRMDVRSVPIRAERRTRVDIDIMRYIREVQNKKRSTLRLVIGVPNLDGVTGVRPEPGTATVTVSYADRDSRKEP